MSQVKKLMGSIHSKRNRLFAILFLIGLGATMRLLPHPPNFSPIAAMALFGGALISQGALALMVPVATLFVSDWVLGFHDQMVSVYFSVILITVLGFTLRSRRHFAKIGLVAVSGSTLFYVITNFAVWFQSGLYEKSFSGLVRCYVLALPFFQNALVGDLLYSATFFGVWALAERYVPQWQSAA